MSCALLHVDRHLVDPAREAALQAGDVVFGDWPLVWVGRFEASLNAPRESQRLAKEFLSGG